MQNLQDRFVAHPLHFFIDEEMWKSSALHLFPIEYKSLKQVQRYFDAHLKESERWTVSLWIDGS